MGRVAKADGRVSKDESEAARAVMARPGLTPQLRQAAMRLFMQGKQADFPLDDVLAQFRRECRQRHTSLQLCMEFLLMAAYADGAMHAAKRRILLHVNQ